jgi:hypothetical protein
MKRRYYALIGLIIASMFFVAACSGTSSGSGGSGTQTPGATATTAPTATPKPKPTGAPAVTMATCQSLMTISEANQIMNPSSPATTLQANSSDGFGVCNYLAGSTLVLKIFLETYIGPVPVPQSTLEGLLAQLAGSTGATIDSATTVSGVGDQAAYLAASLSEQGVSLVAHVFYTIYGKVIFGCLTYVINGVGTNGTQAQLQQCATQVVSRL